MRKITLVAALSLGWPCLVPEHGIGIRTLTPTRAVAGSTDNAPVMMTGAKGLPTSPYADYEIVVH